MAAGANIHWIRVFLILELIFIGRGFPLSF